MNKKIFTTKRILYALVSLFTFIYALFEVNYEQSILAIIMTILIGLFLTQWYLFVGLIKSRDKKIVEDDVIDDVKDEDKNEEEEDGELHFFKQRDDGTLLPRWQVITLSAIVTIYIISLGFLSDENFDFMGALVIFLYIMGPAVFLLIKKGYSLVLTTLWVWFPIEWSLISDTIKIDIGWPFPALLGLFAVLWPAIMYGRHMPWYDWNIKKSDLKPVNISILILTIVVVPLGVLLYFLKINFEEFAGNSFGESFGLILITFAGIFVVQGIMEETLFRDIIMKHWYYEIKDLRDSDKKFLKKIDYGVVSIIFGGILIISIPFWGDVLRFIADIIPIFEGVALRVGDLHRPLGEYEGVAIPAFVGIPVWPFYLIVGILLMIGGLILYKKTDDPLMAALAVSAMIFGFAHFQDWRYVLFATFSGYGYGYAYYKTKNVAAAALVHMGVDAVWSLILSYP
ncbi:MAG: CPBP family glutamic-type intramembrane protease [Promethearchaeota archaeon]